MNSKPEPITVLIAVILSLQAIGAGLTQVATAVGDDTEYAAALGVAAVVVDVVTAAALVGIGVVVRGQVTPNRDVAEYRNGAGLLLAGPANELPTGTIVRAAGTLDPDAPPAQPATDLQPVDDGVDYRAGDPVTGLVDELTPATDSAAPAADDNDAELVAQRADRGDA